MSYPKSEDKKIQKITNMLIRYAEQNDIEFCFGEDEIYALETFSHFGGLSLFLLEAKETYEKLYNNLFTVEELMDTFGKKIKQLSIEELVQEQEYLSKQPITKKFPIIFEQDEEDTYFGFIPRIDTSIDSDFYSLAHFTQYSVEEYVKQYKLKKSLLINGKIPLDPLYDKMVKKINAKKVEIIPQIKKPEKEMKEIQNTQQSITSS